MVKALCRAGVQRGDSCDLVLSEIKVEHLEFCSIRSRRIGLGIVTMRG